MDPFPGHADPGVFRVFRTGHVRRFSRNGVGHGYLVAVTGLCGSYGVYVALTGRYCENVEKLHSVTVME